MTRTNSSARLLGLVVAGGVSVLGVGLLAWSAFALDARADAHSANAPTAVEGSASVSAPTPVTPPARGAGRDLVENPEGIADLVDRAWSDSLAAEAGIPSRAMLAYAGAAIRISEEQPGCGVGWNTLAGIGQVESEHGTISGGGIDPSGQASPPIVGIPLDGTSTDRIPDTDGGALDGDPVWDRAVGPMQFIPSTWAGWGADGDGDGIANPQSIDDSALSAARYLCHVGGDLSQPENWIAAVGAYNSAVEYNNRVAEAASHYAALGSPRA